MTEDRLQKILSRAGVASRRQAEDLIRAGRVTVNGEVAELGRQADPTQDAVKVDGKRIPDPSPPLYYLLNKPPGVMSTRHDPEGRPTVMDHVPEGLRSLLVPVGRLDYHSEGLLLLTNDGRLAQRLTHPRYGCVKVYEAKVKGAPDEAEVEKLRQGIYMDGKRTQPAGVRASKGSRGARRASENTWWTVHLSEGRTRQIREMFFRIGHPVQRLRRVAIGPLSDPHLPSGEIRTLTVAEVEALREATRKPVKRTQKRQARSKAKPKPKPKSRAEAPSQDKPGRDDRGTRGPSKGRSTGKGRPAGKGRPPGKGKPPGKGRSSSRAGGSSRGGPQGKPSSRGGSRGGGGGRGGGRGGGGRRGPK